MIRLLLWFLWVWFMADFVDFLRDNFPMLSQHPWEAIGYGLGAFAVGAGVTIWNKKGQVDGLKEQISVLKEREANLRDVLKQEENRAKVAEKQRDEALARLSGFKNGSVYTGLSNAVLAERVRNLCSGVEELLAEASKEYKAVEYEAWGKAASDSQRVGIRQAKQKKERWD